MQNKSDDLYLTISSSVATANNALIQVGVLPSGLDQSRVVVEPAKDPSHGDIATNPAMVLAKEANANPRQLDNSLVLQLQKDPLVASAGVAGPCFVKLRLKANAGADVVRSILINGASCERSGLG